MAPSKTFKRLFHRVVIACMLWFLFLPIALLAQVARALYSVLTLYLLLPLGLAKSPPRVVRTPEERFASLPEFPFSSRYVSLTTIINGERRELPRVHYIDQGPKDAKETILCLHGEPSWSYLYRTIISGCVSSGFRVVALDFVGFGKSDKYTRMEEYTHEMHRQTLLSFIKKLELNDVTLVVQDWGGLTGLSCVKDCPEVFSRLVIMNTGLPTGREFSGEGVKGILSMALGHPFLLWRCFVMTVGQLLPVGILFRLSCGLDKKRSEPYEAPFPSSLYKAGAAKWPLLVPIHPTMEVAWDMHETRRFLREKWSGGDAHGKTGVKVRPSLILFSDKDPMTRGMDKMFLKLMPNSKRGTVHGGGHFLQETHGYEIAKEITRYISEAPV